MEFFKENFGFLGQKMRFCQKIFGNFWDFIHKGGEKFSKIIDPFSPKNFP
jgi:hypothetical protein